MTQSQAPTVTAASGRRWSVGYAVVLGVVCHGCFALAIAEMIWVMASGMSHAHGRAPWPWSLATNGLLLFQFAVAHSFLLSRPGSRVLRAMAPGSCASRMATTTYATVASIQVLLLFTLWSPCGVVWWRAEGLVLYLICGLYAGAWLLLLKSIIDAGFAVQVGLLGWWAVARGREPAYPPMPTKGLFRWTRQPIYLSFALTLWTVPVWTPDQLEVAVVLTGYCLAGPLFKEARFRSRFGAAFEAYRAVTPYWLPWRLRARR